MIKVMMSKLSLMSLYLERKMWSLMIQIRSLLTEKILKIRLMMIKLMNKSLTKKMKSSKELIERHQGNLVISVILTFRLSLP